MPLLLLTACSSPQAIPPAAPPVQQDIQAQNDIAVAGLSDFYTQSIEWRNCGNADCTTFEVPLDYSDPQGARVTLSMTKIAATGEPIGSLFVNPGGPGGSAVEYAKAADYIVTQPIREVYDVVGVDPRGVGLSEPIDCLTDPQTDAFIAGDSTPDTELEASRLILDAVMVGQACLSQDNPLIGHMSTPNVARDMDIARALVGDPVMNLLGKSYGTALGATYMQLFPQRVGRIVLDGVLPTYLDQLEVTQAQAEEFEVLLRYFVESCLGLEDCPLSGGVDSGVRQIQEFLFELDSQPLVSSDERELTEGLAAYAILSYLYFPASDFDQLRPALNQAMVERNPDALLKLLDLRISRAPDGRYTDNSTDSFYAVACLDLPVSASVDDVREYVDQLAISAPTFGQALGWGVLTCKDWPYQAPSTTDNFADDTPPVMIVVTENDPATPAQWGLDLASKLGNAEVVLWQGGYNHTGYYEGSDCVTETVDTYLLEGTINPGATTTCG